MDQFTREKMRGNFSAFFKLYQKLVWMEYDGSRNYQMILNCCLKCRAGIEQLNGMIFFMEQAGVINLSQRFDLEMRVREAFDTKKLFRVQLTDGEIFPCRDE